MLDTLEESRERDAQELQFLTTLGPGLHRGPRLRRARSRADPAPRARTVPADRGAAAAVRDHAGHVGVAHRARRPAAVRGPGRRRDGARRTSERPRHADGSAVHAGRHDVLPWPSSRAPVPASRRRWPPTTTASARSSGPPITGHNAGVTHRCYLALALWHLGYPDQALKLDSRDASSWPATIGHAVQPRPCRGLRGLSLPLLPARGRGPGGGRGRDRHRDRTGLSRSGTRWARSHKGAGLLLQGRREEALPLLLKGFDAFRATGAEVRVPSYLGMLGDAYTQAGRFEDAHKALNEGLAVAEKNDDRCHEAELHRLKGELLLAESPDQGRRRRLLPPGHRDGPAPAEQGVGAAGHDESRPALATAGPPRRGPRARWRPSTARTRKVSRRRTSWTPQPCSKPWKLSATAERSSEARSDEP